jgi:hypothetical protein
LILNNFYWRNTKESIQAEENDLPPYSNKVVLIDFHPIEKALYDDGLKEIDRLLEVCSSPLIVNANLARQVGAYTNFSNQSQVFPHLDDARAKFTECRRVSV